MHSNKFLIGVKQYKTEHIFHTVIHPSELKILEHDKQQVFPGWVFLVPQVFGLHILNNTFLKCEQTEEIVMDFRRAHNPAPPADHQRSFCREHKQHRISGCIYDTEPLLVKEHCIIGKESLTAPLFPL